MTKIKTLKEQSGESIYPLTSTKAVVDENGNTIEDRLVVADGEDLVTDGNVLRLKDRPNTDGMGYVILRKGKTFQEQVKKANTIYEIRHDFDLGGEEVVIPESCVLKFEGGSIGNGTIDFNQAKISAGHRESIFWNLANFFGVRRVSACWFGIKGDGTTDNTDKFKWLCNTWHYRDDENVYWHQEAFEIFIPSGIYIIRGCINESVYTDVNRYRRYALIGEGSKVQDTLPAHNKKTGLCERTIIYCVGNYTEKPFLYAPTLIKAITVFGEYIYDDTADYANKYVCKNADTTAISISAAPNALTGEPVWAANRRLEDVQIAYFGTGLIEGVSYSCNMDSVHISRCINGFIYESDENSEWSNTFQTMTKLTVEYCRERGLFINTPSFNSFLHFANFTCQFNNLNNIGTELQKPQAEIISGRGVTIDGIYVEQWGNKDKSNIVCKFNVDFLVLQRANFYEGTYQFDGKCNDLSNIKDVNAILVFTEETGTSVIRNSMVYKVSGGKNLMFVNCLNANGTNIPFGGAYVIGDTHPQAGIPDVKNIYAEIPNAPLFYNRGNKTIWGKVQDELIGGAYEFEIPTFVGQIKQSDTGTDEALTMGTNRVIYSGGGPSTYKKDVFGRTLTRLYGATSPSGLNDTTDIGFQYFNTTLGKPITWNGTEWIEADGNSAGVKRAGTWKHRPNADGSYLENGYMYFLLESTPDVAPDGSAIESLTGNGKPIWWIQDSRKWVDALGNTITGSLGITKVNEVRHLINGEEYKFLTTDEEGKTTTIYAPTQIESDGYIVAAQSGKAQFVDPADIGLK